MKTNIIYSLLLAFILPCLVFAQDKRPMNDRMANMKDRVETMKIGFLTERLNLTPDEAKSFWPVYNNFQNELEQLRKSRRDNLNNTKEDFSEMTDAEVEKTVDNELNFRQSELDIQKKYQPQFKKVLPIKKVARLFRAEEDFKRQLLEKIQQRREDRRDDRRGMDGR